MRFLRECRNCRQQLSVDEFAFRRSTRTRSDECGVCRNQRLAKKHRGQAAKHNRVAEDYSAEAARLLRVRAKCREYWESRARAGAGAD